MDIGVLGSGKGSNLQALIDALQNGSLPAHISIVISDVEDAFILKRAAQYGIPARFIYPGEFKTKLSAESELEYINALKDAGAELIILAGFMRMLKERFLAAFPGRIMNIHPSLLPAFGGLRAWEQALEYGVKFTGCTVHFLDIGMDTGPVISQAVVPVMPDDTPDILHRRIQEEEHRIYPEAVKLFVQGRLAVSGRKVIVEESR